MRAYACSSVLGAGRTSRLAASLGRQCSRIVGSSTPPSLASKRVCVGPQRLRQPRHGLRSSAVTVIRASAQDAEADDDAFEVDLQITGMKCEGCVESVTSALKAAPKVLRVTSVDLATGLASCEVQAETMFEAAAHTSTLVDAVKKAGFSCTPLL